MGAIGQALVTLPAGYSTVYFPVIKLSGSYPDYTYGATIRWIRRDQNGSGDGAVCDHGGIYLVDFQNPGAYGYTQTLYPAMIYPVVCYSSTPRTITVELSRTDSNGTISFGRPIALPGACSWFITQ